MIGSGIFIVSADITRQIGSPAALLAVWVAAGLLTLGGALAYGELAAMMPQAGGQYVFLREAYGGAIAFAFGWTLLLVIQSGTIAAVAVAFARFAAVMWPLFGSQIFLGLGNVGFSAERLAAIAVITLLTVLNQRGLRIGAIVQNSFTIAKLSSLITIVLAGCIFAPKLAALRLNFGSAAIFFGEQPLSPSRIATFGAAMVGALFSSDAWGSVTFAAAEVRDPARVLPRALAFGAGMVIILYLFTNLAYLCQLPAQPHALSVGENSPVFAHGIADAAHDRVATAAMQMVWGGAGATITAIIVMVSTLGCANGLILTGARALYALAQDGLFFAAAGHLNRSAVPGVALMLQGTWAALLTLSGSYSELLDYVIFAQLLFYALTVGALFILRIRRPEATRPYRAWGYPAVPALYLVSATALMIDLLVMRPAYTWPGLLIALSALPLYRLLTSESRQARMQRTDDR
jgi:APA family basic amino acid/polyamine antiporter